MTKKITPSKKQPSKPSSTALTASKKAPLKKQPIKKNLVKKISEKAAPKKIAAVAKPSQTIAPKKITPIATAKKATVSKKRTPKLPVSSRGVLRQTFVTQPKRRPTVVLTPFFEKQRQRLLVLKDTLLDSIQGVSRDNLHAGSDSSGFGMHQADAGSDAYDRDFALSILSQEQNSLYEIDEALKRIDDGTYGICEVSNKQIPRARLEARPFTRFTVECQAELEKRQHFSGARLPVSSLFGLTEEETENEDEENIIENTKD